MMMPDDNDSLPKSYCLHCSTEPITDGDEVAVVPGGFLCRRCLQKCYPRRCPFCRPGTRHRLEENMHLSVRWGHA
jgi:hypothetical protein